MLSTIVGFGLVDQQIPFVVTGLVPIKITLPPPLAVALVIFVIGLVITEAALAKYVDDKAFEVLIIVPNLPIAKNVLGSNDSISNNSFKVPVL